MCKYLPLIILTFSRIVLFSYKGVFASSLIRTFTVHLCVLMCLSTLLKLGKCFMQVSLLLIYNSMEFHIYLYGISNLSINKDVIQRVLYKTDFESNLTNTSRLYNREIIKTLFTVDSNYK